MLIKNKAVFVYDLESFPNLFTCTFKNTESLNTKVYEISSRRNDLLDLVKLFKHPKIYFCGYNNLGYDDVIIAYLISNVETLSTRQAEEVCLLIKELSDKIILSPDRNNDPSIRQYRFQRIFPSLDLMAMKFSGKLRVGLKEMQVTMGYPNVEEYGGDFNSKVPSSDIEKVISYNLNDVNSTARLLDLMKDDIELRLGIEQRYGIDVLNKDSVNLGMEIIKSRYLKATGQSWNDIKDLRSPCNMLSFGDIVFDFISFKTPEMQKILSEVKSLRMNPNERGGYERSFTIGGVPHTFSLGGLHSANEPGGIYEPSSDEVLIDKDVTSLYPSIVIEHGICPEHLDKDKFQGIFRQMREERVAAKRSGDTITNMTLKLALNGFTGNLQSQFSWVYSPKAVMAIRINGQLMLMMLLERLNACGVKIIQSNTDGVFFQCRKADLPKVEAACAEWEKITRLNLEDDYFERFYQYSVNDYIGVKKGWSETHDPKLIKTKGHFLDEITLGKGMSPLVVADAIREYFVNGTPIERTVLDCNDIKKFLTYQKIDRKFTVEYDGKPVQHINRYYMSTNGKHLRKVLVDPVTGERGNPQEICADSGVTLFNEFRNISPREANVNYVWYIKSAMRFIEPFQRSAVQMGNLF